MASEGCNRLLVLFLLMVSMAALVVALMTDYWFDVETTGLVTSLERQNGNYRFGLWRRCYDDRPDTFVDPDVDKSGDSCVWIFKDLIPDNEDDLSSDGKIRIHLMRSTLGLSIAAIAFLLFALISLLCAWAPGSCSSIQSAKSYTIALIIVVFAFMCAIASGVCFIAARDVEEHDLKMYTRMGTAFLWSFMLHWAGTGVVFFTACYLLYLVAHSHKDVTNKSHYYYSY